MKPKQIIIDKDAFIGIKFNDLCNFAQNYSLILPDVLYFECATTDKNKEKLLDRFRTVILSGADICPSCKDIIQKEAKNLFPYGSLVDLKKARAVRKTFQLNSRPYSPQNAQEKLEEELDMARQVINTAEGFNEKLILEDPELLSEVRRWDNSKNARPERFLKWAELVDTQNMHESAKIMLNSITVHPEKFCLSKEWISWHFLRLMHILIHERSFQRHTGGKSSESIIEHDLNDIEYVLFLSRADGLLTRDEKLVKPLAKAAFPEKDVFSSLDEVPDEYLCNWS